MTRPNRSRGKESAKSSEVQGRLESRRKCEGGTVRSPPEKLRGGKNEERPMKEHVIPGKSKRGKKEPEKRAACKPERSYLS